MRKLLFLLIYLLLPPEAALAHTVLVSWYEDGEVMANGEKFDPDDPHVAAHKKLPFGTLVMLENPTNGMRLLVTIKDRGPAIKNRKLDLSRAGAKWLGFQERGVQKLKMDVIYSP